MKNKINICLFVVVCFMAFLNNYEEVIAVCISNQESLQEIPIKLSNNLRRIKMMTSMPHFHKLPKKMEYNFPECALVLKETEPQSIELSLLWKHITPDTLVSFLSKRDLRKLHIHSISSTDAWNMIRSRTQEVSYSAFRPTGCPLYPSFDTTYLSASVFENREEFLRVFPSMNNSKSELVFDELTSLKGILYTNMPNLEELRITNISDFHTEQEVIFNALRFMSHLKILDLSNNSLESLEYFPIMFELEELHLGKNNFENWKSVLRAVSNLSKLQKLIFSRLSSGVREISQEKIDSLKKIIPLGCEILFEK